jgi:hypothetical protein
MLQQAETQKSPLEFTKGLFVGIQELEMCANL